MKDFQQAFEPAFAWPQQSQFSEPERQPDYQRTQLSHELRNINETEAAKLRRTLAGMRTQFAVSDEQAAEWAGPYQPPSQGQQDTNLLEDLSNALREGSLHPHDALDVLFRHPVITGDANLGRMVAEYGKATGRLPREGYRQSWEHRPHRKGLQTMASVQ